MMKASEIESIIEKLLSLVKDYKSFNKTTLQKKVTNELSIN